MRIGVEGPFEYGAMKGFVHTQRADRPPLCCCGGVTIVPLEDEVLAVPLRSNQDEARRTVHMIILVSVGFFFRECL